MVALFFAAIVVKPLPTPPCTPDSAPSQYVAPGVKYYNSSGFYPLVHIVTVHKTLPAMEVQLLLSRRSDDPLNTAHLKRVQDLAVQHKAVVAINGHYWGGDIKDYPRDDGDLVPIRYDNHYPRHQAL